MDTIKQFLDRTVYGTITVGKVLLVASIGAIAWVIYKRKQS